MPCLGVLTFLDRGTDTLERPPVTLFTVSDQPNLCSMVVLKDKIGLGASSYLGPSSQALGSGVSEDLVQIWAFGIRTGLSGHHGDLSPDNCCRRDCN